ncbi:hypothetical protein NP233_g8643 [Leucocoprinus birnbaumii]|uniref:Fungal-type protein kinase domain-containing protein n=1 Tax=Leucocoprinus birnbaumii TaxID=56174 RepID=A0AAD5VLX0_9AGAR|nr:hypothetical protein NP233_g8643 [Leucocoprinus birnbaumii]
MAVGSLSSEKKIQTALFEKTSQIVEADYDWVPDDLKDCIKKGIESSQRFFVEVLHDGWGSSLREGIGDRDFSAGDPGLPSRPFISNAAPEVSQGDQIVESKYSVLKQYQVVHSHVGHPLHNVRDLEASLKAIQDVLIDVLRTHFLRSRKMTPFANLLKHLSSCFSLGGHIGIKLDSEGLDLSTGNPYFLPIEIHSGRQTNDRPRERYLLNIGDTGMTKFDHIGKKRPVYMPRHDLESLMVWVVVWVVLQLDFTQAEEALHLVFVDSSTPCDARWDFFRDTDADTVKQIDAGFHPALSELDDAGSFADHFTTVKAHIYDLSTTTFNDDPSQAAYFDLYWNVWKHFTEMLSRIQSFNDLRMAN